MTLTDGGEPRRVEVPVELPEGMARQEGDADELKVVGFVGGTASRRPSRQASVTRQWRSADSAYIIMPSPTPPPSTAKPQVQQPPNPSATDKAQTEIHVNEAAVTVTNSMIVDGLNTSDSLPAPTKLHPSLVAIVERLKKPDSKPGDGESKFVRDGKAEVQIWLTEKTPEVLAQLKQLGFELLLDPKSAKLVIGRLPVEKLAALAELKAVRYVSPQTR
jgi:hypothetical protein